MPLSCRRIEGSGAGMDEPFSELLPRDVPLFIGPALHLLRDFLREWKKNAGLVRRMIASAEADFFVDEVGCDDEIHARILANSQGQFNAI
jgi:hypothetical protein